MNHESPEFEPLKARASSMSGAMARVEVQRSVDGEGAYGGVFWLTYVANSSLMFAVSVLFRYADFVQFLHGSAGHLGLIVGIGSIGALSMRMFQGVGIDRYGPRRVWLLSLVLFMVSMLAHLPITRVDGVAIYLVRILMTTSLAGAFGASITYVSLRVPEVRMAEIIGTLGSSGFLGMALGPTLGDWLFEVPEITRYHIDRMFWLAAVAGAVSFVAAALATRGEVRRKPRRRQPPFFRLVWRYHPGIILLVSVAMGVGIGMPHTFLKAFASELDIVRIKWFFLVYAATAFLVRISVRGVPERYGIRAMILGGLACLSVSLLLYLIVTDRWLLMVPAVMGGVAHALLFPAVVGGGSVSFPSRYRGLATTLMLAMFDLGVLVGQPLIGGIVVLAPRFGLPGYPTMFVTLAVAMAVVGVIYAVMSRARPALMAAASQRISEVEVVAAEVETHST
jgi:MFS family permease